jgi:aerobic-type carbon monoxide dehydrogenase small subunit (CoxS/CutS family)
MSNLATSINLNINGKSVKVAEKTSVAAAIINSGSSSTRNSIKGEKRGPLCGMGICYECRASVNGVEHTRTCMLLCEEGMEVIHE